MKVLFFGDIVGEPGLEALERELPALRERMSPTSCWPTGKTWTSPAPRRGRRG